MGKKCGSYDSYDPSTATTHGAADGLVKLRGVALMRQNSLEAFLDFWFGVSWWVYKHMVVFRVHRSMTKGADIRFRGSLFRV